MPAWWILPAIQAATSVVNQAINKPEQDQADTTYYDRLINNIRGRVTHRDVRRSSVEAGMMPLTTANRRNQESINYNTRPGADRTTATLLNNEKFLEGATKIGLNAGAQEAAANETAGRQLDDLEARREAMIAAEKEKYRDQLDEWNDNWVKMGVNAAGNFAGAKLGDMAKQEAIAQKKADAEAALDRAIKLANAKAAAAEALKTKRGLDTGYDDYINSLPEDAQMSPMSREMFGKMYKGSEYATPGGFSENMKFEQPGTGGTIKVTSFNEDGSKVVREVADTEGNREILKVEPGTKSVTLGGKKMKVTNWGDDGEKIVQEIDVTPHNLKALGLPEDTIGVESITFPKPGDESDMVSINTYDEKTGSTVTYEVPRDEFKKEFGDSYPEGTKSVRTGKPAKDRSAEAEQSLIDLRNNVKLIDTGEGSKKLLNIIDNVDKYEDSDIAAEIYDFSQKADIPDGGWTIDFPDGTTMDMGSGKDLTSKRRSLYNGLSKMVWYYKKLKSGDGGGSLSDALEQLDIEL